MGWASVQKLIQHFGSMEAIFSSSVTDLCQLGLSQSIAEQCISMDESALEKDLTWLQAAPDHHIICPDDVSYPRLLKETASPPLVLYAFGEKSWLHTPQIAVVGSRNPTSSGRELTYDFARALAEQGITITSGLALGIDGIAHQAALDAGMGTIAVAGTGLDRVYPARHQSLAKTIAEKGLLISELPLGTGVRGTHFPRRNRIISGLSLGVLVIEAAIKSGSLITALQATDIGRDVFAVPGSIHNPLSKGCHALIKQGAYLVETLDDIFEQLGWQSKLPLQNKGRSQTNESSQTKELGDAQTSLWNALNEEDKQLLSAIDYSSTSLDVIVERTQKNISEVSAKLLALELDGWVASVAGGYQRKK